MAKNPDVLGFDDLAQAKQVADENARNQQANRESDSTLYRERVRLEDIDRWIPAAILQAPGTLLVDKFIPDIAMDNDQAEIWEAGVSLLRDTDNFELIKENLQTYEDHTTRPMLTQRRPSHYFKRNGMEYSARVSGLFSPRGLQVDALSREVLVEASKVAGNEPLSWLNNSSHSDYLLSISSYRRNSFEAWKSITTDIQTTGALNPATLGRIQVNSLLDSPWHVYPDSSDFVSSVSSMLERYPNSRSQFMSQVPSVLTGIRILYGRTDNYSEGAQREFIIPRPLLPAIQKPQAFTNNLDRYLAATTPAANRRQRFARIVGRDNQQALLNDFGVEERATWLLDTFDLGVNYANRAGKHVLSDVETIAREHLVPAMRQEVATTRKAARELLDLLGARV